MHRDPIWLAQKHGLPSPPERWVLVRVGPRWDRFPALERPYHAHEWEPPTPKDPAPPPGLALVSVKRDGKGRASLALVAEAVQTQ